MAESRKYYYARVSSNSQNLDRQIEAFIKMGADERSIISDKQSGKDLDRKGYQALRDTLLRPGDTLVIKSLDRLSRRKEDIKNELEYYKCNKIRLQVLDLPTTMIDLPPEQDWIFDMINNILIEVLASIAEQERITLRQRQAEGIAIARQKGKKMGRPKMEFPIEWDEVYTSWKSGRITAKKAMNDLKMKHTTFYKLASEYNP